MGDGGCYVKRIEPSLGGDDRAQKPCGRDLDYNLENQTCFKKTAAKRRKFEYELAKRKQNKGPAGPTGWRRRRPQVSPVWRPYRPRHYNLY